VHLRFAGPLLHRREDVGPARDAAARQTAREDLRERRHVGLHAVMRLRPAGTDAEPGNDLIEDQDAVGLVRQLAETLEERAADRHNAPVTTGRLEDYTADLRVTLERLLDAIQVVRRQDDRILRHGIGYAGHGRAVIWLIRGRHDEIVPAVEVALK